jgi:hypothetical protein
MREVILTPMRLVHPPLSCRTSPPQGGRSAQPERLPSLTRLISPLEGEMPAGRGGCFTRPLERGFAPACFTHPPASTLPPAEMPRTPA